MNNLLKKIWRWIVKAYNTIDEFSLVADKHHIFLVAAGVAFNILLYLIPMMLMALYTINQIFGVEMIASFLTNFLSDILPHNEMTSNMLTSTIQEVNLIFGQSTVAGIIGLISLAWLSSTLFSSLRSGLNTVFEIETRKIFVFYKIKDIVLTVLIAVLMLISSYALPLASVLMSSIQGVLQPPLRDWFSQFSVMMISLSSSFLLYFGLFRFVPNKRQPKFIVYISTLLSVVLIEISRRVFSWYVVRFGTYGKFYGTYAVLVSIAVWIYYMILIILLSAEISSFIYRKVIIPRREMKMLGIRKVNTKNKAVKTSDIPSKSKKAPM